MTRDREVDDAAIGAVERGEGQPAALSRHRLRSESRLPGPGDTIGGKYLVVRVLGQGGMAVVYEATHPRLHQRLAIKVLRPDVQDFEEVLARFEREARATARLRSVHTARVVDVDTLPNGLPYIVMEYLDGQDLDAALQAGGRMSVERAVDIGLQIADAMQEAHGIGIVHRDLKPANIFLCQVEKRVLVKVLDYGVSKSEHDAGSRITQAHAYFGTPCYAAPEQLRSAGDADARSDVWSLGIILFELLTARTPFVGSTTSVIAKVMTDPIPSPCDLVPDIPRDLGAVVLRALDRDPAQRFQTMQAFASALQAFGPGDQALPSRSQGPRGRLGEILIGDGLLTEVDLKRALEEQRRSGKLLGRVLLELGLVAHADLLSAVARQQGLETLSLARHRQVAQTPAARPSETGLAPKAHQAAGGSTRTILFALAIALAFLGAFGLGWVLRGH